MYPVYALYHYFPEIFWVRISLTMLSLCAGTLVIVLLYKKGKLSKHSRNISILLWIYTLFLLYITIIGRYTFDDYRERLIPFESYRQYFTTGNISELKGIILNILIFIPFGFLIAKLFRNRKSANIAFCSGFFLTVAIESLQYITHTGTFETDDIIHNSIGTMIGCLLWIAMKHRKSVSQSRN